MPIRLVQATLDHASDKVRFAPIQVIQRNLLDAPKQTFMKASLVTEGERRLRDE